MRVSDEQWSDWISVIGDLSQIPIDAGIYRLRAVNDVNGSKKPTTILRIGGSDYEGLLYFGRAKSLKSRIRELRPKGRHNALIAHLLLVISTQKVEDFAHVEVSVRRARYEDAPHEEKLELLKYLCQFGELPPLNRSVPGGIIQALLKVNGRRSNN